MSPGDQASGLPEGATPQLNTVAAYKAQNDLATAYSTIGTAKCTADLSGKNLGSMVLTPGVYCITGAAQLDGTLQLDGNNTYILDQQDWHGKLTPEMTCLSKVQLDLWGGFIYINMDAEAGPLSEWMGRCGEILGHFEFAEMRYKWRQWAIYPCNWKTAIEAFMEPYHVAGTHTQLLAYGRRTPAARAAAR